MNCGSSFPHKATDSFGGGCEKDCAHELLGVGVHHSWAGYYSCLSPCFDVGEFWLLLGRRSVLLIHGQYPSEPGEPLED